MSVKFVSAILGPEMAPILQTPGKNAFFLQENLHVHKIPRFGGGNLVLGGGGGSADFIFMGAGIFLIYGVFSGKGFVFCFVGEFTSLVFFAHCRSFSL